MKSSFFAAAASMALAPAVKAATANVLDSGKGFATYYYDVVNTKGCSDDFTNINGGVVECSNAALTLDQINSNNVVAMNHTLLASDPAKYCGKRVIISVNGVASDIPFVIGDGCQRCGTGSSSNGQWNPDGAPGLDLSLGQLSALSGDACTQGHVDIEWQIVDETILNFDSISRGSSAASSSPSFEVVSPSSEAAGPSTAAANPTTLATSLSTAAAGPSTLATSLSTAAASSFTAPAIHPVVALEESAQVANQSAGGVSNCRRSSRSKRSAKMRARKDM